MENTKKYIIQQVSSKRLDAATAAVMLREIQEGLRKAEEDIAIIGISGRFPGSNSVEEYWDNLVKGECFIRKFPQSRRTDTDPFLSESLKQMEEPYQIQGYIEEIDKFDAAFFNLTPAEVAAMDPNQRILLQTIWESIEDAGLGGKKIYGSKTGVFIGKAHLGEPMYKEFIAEKDEHAFVGSVSGIISSRISYILNLKGPSIVVDTACSSGLVALHLACRSLKDGECEQAIAGGISLSLFPTKENSVSMLESPENGLFVFEKKSSGTVWGEGAGSIVLKPLSKALADNDNIYAVIKGSAINNDGASNGITAPSPEAQEEILLSAWEKAKVSPETISYIETHGTGTPLGDPIEIKALTAAFKRYTSKKQFCAIGGVKPNIGHLVAASGIASAFKVILALKHKMIPPTIKFDRPSDYINFCGSPVYVNDKLIDWETDGCPRRAGVSSFGLSGTNCHFVFEEAPKKEDTCLSSRTEVLTLSAKKESLLKELLASYREFISNSKGLSIQDICFTSCTGRGHYNNRLVLIVKDKADLENKIINLCKYENLSDIKLDGVYYGDHNVVTSIKKVVSQGDITEEQRRDLTKTALGIIQKYVEVNRCDNTLLNDICKLYIKGASIDWESFYKGEKRNRVSIPFYPFEKKHCWTPLKPIMLNTQKEEEKIIHPLVEKCLAKSLLGDIYSTEFSSSKHWVLDGHRIMDNCVIPGTAYIEMALNIGRMYYGEGIELRDVMILMPAILQDEDLMEVQTIIKKEKDFLEFAIVSKKDSEKENGNWIEHVVGKIYKTVEAVDKIYNINEIKKLCEGEERWLNPNELSKGYIKFGQRWVECCKLKGNNYKAVAELTLPMEFSSDLNEYYAHPSLIDMAVNALGFVLGEDYLPLSYNSFRVYMPIPGKFYSYIRRRDNSNEETITYDIEFIDTSGKLLGEVSGYVTKKAKGIEKLLKIESMYSMRKWVKREPRQGSRPFETVLVLNNNNILAKQILRKLKELAKNVIEVACGNEYRAESGKYVIGESEADYKKLMNAIKGNKISHIIHIDSNSSMLESEACLKKNIDSAFYIIKSLTDSGIKNETELIFISDSVYDITGTESRLNPEGAGVFALGKTAGREHGNLKIKCMDIGDNTPDYMILDEIKSSDYGNISAYREGERYVEEIVKVENENLSEEVIEIQENGVYVITGGAGAIGLEVSRYLAAKNNIKLVLINRSAIPQRDNWDEILKSGVSDKMCRIISAVKEIEATGSVVDIYSADISKKQDISNVLDDVRNKYGRINGVIHSAGVAGNSFLSNETKDIFDSVLKPKIFGAWLLDRLTREDDLDFFIMFSSVAAIIGIPGQGDYSAANAFMDAYAVYRRKNTNKKTLSINWPAWKEIGMAVDYKANVDTIFKAITNRQAIQAFEEVLNRKTENIIVGDWNYSSFEIIEQLSLNLSDEIRHKIEQYKKRALSESNIQESQVVLLGRDDGAYTPTERAVAKIWAKVLGYEEINITDNFYDLGGDSILAVKLINALNKQMNLSIDISEVLSYLTVSDFAEYLDSKNKVADEKINDRPGIKPCENKEFYRASSEQSRLYVLYQLSPESTSYNLPGVFEVNGKLDKGRLKESIKKLIKRHESLRTYFEMIEGVLVQKILEDADIEIEEIEATQENAPKLISSFIRPFNLETAPILRIMLLKISEEKHLLAIDIHHIVADGSSVAILVKDFIALYSYTKLPELKIQYKDYAEYQNALIGSDEMNRYEEFWIENLSGEIPVLNLPVDFKRPSVQSFEGDKIEFNIDKDILSELKRISAKNNVTLYMTLLAAYNVLLSKYTSQEDIIVGSPVAGRMDQELENVMGMFVNTLPMRNRPVSTKTFEEFLAEVKNNSMKAFDNQNLRLEALIKKLDIERDTSRNPIFDTTFILQNADKNIEITNFGMPKIEIQLDKLGFKTFEFEHNISQFDLTLEVLERENGLKCYLVYCTKLFKRETISRMSMHFINILEQIVKNTAIKIGNIAAITEKEKNQILYDFNDTKADYRKNALLHEMLEEQAIRNPDGIAVIFRNNTFTYSQLNEKSNRLARKLRKEGVGRESIVGIMAYRSFEMIIGIMAILKAGGAYMPISPDYPEDRILFMMEDSKAEILLTQNEFIKSINFGGKVINLDDSSLYEDDNTNLEKINSSCDIAYIIYTSGSTGKPKGVMIEHCSVINRINWMQKMYPIYEDDVILQKTPYTFDVSVWELFWWSFQGAKVCLLEPGGEKYPEMIVDAVEKNKITTMHFVPSMLNIFLEYVEDSPDLERLRSLRQVFASGEALTLQQVKRFNESLYKRFNTKLSNLYGPTEATVDVSYFNCSTEGKLDIVPIGKPIDNIHLYVMAPDNKLQPIGIPGELCISGDGVGRGYLNRPDLTNEKFVSDPFFHGARMYKTGDLTRWMPDGNIEYLGRIDHQVKIRGFRIELGEIETAILKFNNIREAVVIDRKDPFGNKYLCAYVVHDGELDIDNLRTHLLSMLPDYMVPAYFVKLDKMPLSSNGKVNRKQLPEPQESMKRETAYVAPRNKIEEIMVDVWSDVLGIKVGITDNFFKLGGDSIKAIQLIARLQKYNLKLVVKDIFEYPTIKEVSALVKVSKTVIDQGPVEGLVLLTPVQKWFLENISTDRSHYNQSFTLYKRDGFDENALRKTIDKIIEHHDALRMTFKQTGVEITQYNSGLQEKAYGFEVVDLRSEPGYLEIIKQESDKYQNCLDIESGKLLQTVIFKTSYGDYLLLIIHHLVVDGISWRIIFEDLARGYMQVLNNEEVKFQDKTHSYKEWSDKLHIYANSNSLLKEKDYWRTIAKTEVKPLPIDSVSEENTFKDTKTLSVELTKEETGNLLENVDAVYNTKINDILLTALGMAFKQWTGNDRILINLEGHGREEIEEDVDISRTVGWFTSMYPVLIDASYSQDISYQIKYVKETIRKIPNKGIGYGILKYLTSQTNDFEFPDFTPEVSFNYTGQFGQDMENDIFEISELTKGLSVGENSNRIYKFDINGVILDGKFILNVSYNENYYKEETVLRLLEYYRDNLLSIIRHCMNTKVYQKTPSDYGNSLISIEELDYITSEAGSEIQNIYSLSPMQEGMLFHSLLGKGDGTYFEQFSFDMNGELNVKLFEESFNKLLERHDIFRTLFISEKLRKPQQIVLKERKASVYFEDISEMNDKEKVQYLDNFRARDRARGFKVDSDSLIRLSIIKTQTQMFNAIWSFHHLVMDGWCLSIVLKEVLLVYQALLKGQAIEMETAYPYSDYIKWLEKQDRDEARNYWKSYLEGYELLTSLPKNKGAALGERRHKEHSFRIDASLKEGMTILAARLNVTINDLTQAIWAVLLQRYNNVDDVVFGSVVSGRPPEVNGIEKMVGLFINTVPVRVTAAKDTAFASVVESIRKAAIASEKYSYYPLYELHRMTPLKQSLFDHIIVFENYPIEKELSFSMKQQEFFGFDIGEYKIFEQNTFDFNFKVIPGDELTIILKFNPFVYSEELINEVGEHFKSIADQIVDNENISIGEIKFASAQDHNELLSNFNDNLEDE